MSTKYFLHRIQKEDGAFSKGIEVHDTLNAAVLSFWGRMKYGYDNPTKPGMTFVSCKVTDSNGNVVGKYDMTWLKEGAEEENVFFMHHIRKDGETFSKDIDVCESREEALRLLAAAMEYGYENSKYPNVTFDSCMITDLMSGGMVLFEDTWIKAEAEPDEA